MAASDIGVCIDQRRARLSFSFHFLPATGAFDFLFATKTSFRCETAILKRASVARPSNSPSGQSFCVFVIWTRQPDMSQATVVHRTRFETETSSSVNIFFDTLLIPLVLDNILPYLTVSSLLNLASTNRAFRDLVFGSSRAFRHLDLTNVKRAQFDIDQIDNGGQVWRNAQVDENLTEDE